VIRRHRVRAAAHAVVESGVVPWEQAWAARPRLRGWLHVGALPVALVSTAVLAARRRAHRSSVLAYSAGLSAMLATSAGYHRLTRSEAQYRWTQPADHMMIFAAIAGSATPVVASVLPARRARPFIGLLWGGALVGAAGRVIDIRRGTSISSLAYLVLGWSGIVLLPTVVRRHGVRNGALLGAGGLAYSIGAGLFAAGKPNPYPGVFGYHEVWHAATLVGAACHLVAIADMTHDRRVGDAVLSLEPGGDAPVSVPLPANAPSAIPEVCDEPSLA
jgi:hemolysin III